MKVSHSGEGETAEAPHTGAGAVLLQNGTSQHGHIMALRTVQRLDSHTSIEDEIVEKWDYSGNNKEFLERCSYVLSSINEGLDIIIYIQKWQTFSLYDFFKNFSKPHVDTISVKPHKIPTLISFALQLANL